MGFRFTGTDGFCASLLQVARHHLPLTGPAVLSNPSAYAAAAPDHVRTALSPVGLAGLALLSVGPSVQAVVASKGRSRTPPSPPPASGPAADAAAALAASRPRKRSPSVTRSVRLLANLPNLANLLKIGFFPPGEIVKILLKCRACSYFGRSGPRAPAALAVAAARAGRGARPAPAPWTPPSWRRCGAACAACSRPGCTCCSSRAPTRSSSAVTRLSTSTASSSDRRYAGQGRTRWAAPSPALASPQACAERGLDWNVTVCSAFRFTDLQLWQGASLFASTVCHAESVPNSRARCQNLRP